MDYPQSGSQLNKEIHSGLSTQIIVKVGNVTVGAIQELTLTQTREISRWEEIGTNGIVDSHPQHAAKINLSVNRMVFDQMRLTESLARNFINIQAQRFPFNIEIVDSGAKNTVHTYHNCWFNSYSTPYRASDYIVTETAAIYCDYVTSSLNGGSATIGGSRGIQIERDSIEKNTDYIGNRGFFDPSGLNTKS